MGKTAGRVLLSRLEKLRIDRVDLVAGTALVLVAVFLFRLHIGGAGTFIGNADRLDSYLNVRTFEVDSIHRWGHVPSWNDQMFMGYPTRALHWMLPGVDPTAFLLAAFPLGSLFRVSGYLTMALLALAMLSAYAFLRATIEQPFCATVGALLYGCSALSIQRLSQVDPAFAILILLPIAMLTVRRSTRRNMPSSMVILAVVMFVMLFFTFLQEAPYALLLVGFYALYRGVFRAGWPPIMVFACSAIASGLAALPRLLTVIWHASEVSRASTFSTTEWSELLRWWSDGIFGRFGAEAFRLNPSYNLSEGLQLYSSAFVPGIVLVLAFSVHKRAAGATAALLAVFGEILSSSQFNPWPMRGLTLVVVGAYLLTSGLRGPKAQSPEDRVSSDRLRHADFSFHLAFVALVFGVVFLPAVQWVLQRAFLGVGLVHSRFSMAGLLPISVLVALFLRRLITEDALRNGRSMQRNLVSVAAAGSLAAALLVSIHLLTSAIVDKSWHVEFSNAFPSRLEPTELVKVIVATILFTVLLVLTRVPTKAVLRPLVGYALGFMMVFQSIAFADFRLSGGPTRSFPVPFYRDNSFNAPVKALRPPGAKDRELLQAKLETDRYRTALLVKGDVFRPFLKPSEPAYPAHVSHFWGLRLVEGYGTVPSRIAALPWPKQGLTLRTLSVAGMDPLPWELLAMLNVKYGLVVDKNVYYNLGSVASSATTIQNPSRPLPREFFVSSVRPVPTRGEASRYVDDVLARRNAGALLVESAVEGKIPATELSQEGSINAEYRGDVVRISLDPSRRARFLVLNELYDPNWRALADNKTLPIYPTNVVMRGVFIPPGVQRVTLRYTSFLQSGAAFPFYGGGVAILVLCAVGANLFARRRVSNQA